MTVTITVTLVVTALITSVISAILGMGGGILLLAAMFCFMSHGEAIPTHAAVQIASNGTRVLAFLRNVDGVAFGRFVLGMVPGAIIGTVILWRLGEPDRVEPYLKTLIGVFILLVTYWPKPQARPRDSSSSRGFVGIGFLAGAAALTVGAVGPLIAPAFARNDFVKERLIATKAVCQLSTHVLKIPAFVFLRTLDVPRLGLLAVLMICMVIPGTLIGRRFVHHISERHFIVAYRAALTLAGLKILMFDGVANLLREG